MSTHKIQLYEKKSLNICFLELWKDFRMGLKDKFESSKLNKPSVFESSRFNCTSPDGQMHNQILC